MRWTEIDVKTTNEAVEAISSIFESLDAQGVKIENALDFQKIKNTLNEDNDISDVPHLDEGAIISAYYPDGKDIKNIIKKLHKKIDKLPEFGLNIGDYNINSYEIDDSGWYSTWKKYYHPQRITRYLTVKPSWSDYHPQDKLEQVIILDPGKSFGSGTHPTTKLCLQALEMVVRGGESMYDVGTGSGVLSIGAKILGVKDIKAFDVDENAIKAAKENINLNPVAKDVNVDTNSLLDNISEPVDLIVANILSDILKLMIPQTPNLLKKEGHLVLSGIIDDQVKGIKQQLSSYGYEIEESLRLGEWHALIAKRV